MRYEKKVTWLVGALAALLIIWAAGLVFSPERVAARSESAHLIAGKSADVASVSLSGGSLAAPIQLIKSGAAWTMTDSSTQLPAQSSRVTAFVNALASVTRLRQVARSKDSWAGFQLDDAKAKRATLKDAAGKVLADIYVGSYGPTGGEVYLRRTGSDNSYTVDGSIASYFNYGRPSWLDLAVLGGIKETEVQSFSVKAGIELDGKGKPALALDYGVSRDGKSWKSGAAQLDADSGRFLPSRHPRPPGRGLRRRSPSRSLRQDRRQADPRTGLRCFEGPPDRRLGGERPLLRPDRRSRARFHDFQL